jgi:hypothetical protein
LGRAPKLLGVIIPFNYDLGSPLAGVSGLAREERADRRNVDDVLQSAQCLGKRVQLSAVEHAGLSTRPLILDSAEGVPAEKYVRAGQMPSQVRGIGPGSVRVSALFINVGD